MLHVQYNQTDKQWLKLIIRLFASCVWFPVYVQAFMQWNPSRTVVSRQLPEHQCIARMLAVQCFVIDLVRRQLGLTIGTPTVSMSH